MASHPSMPLKMGNPVSVSLPALQSGTVPFSTLLSAFGPSSLGILVVTALILAVVRPRRVQGLG